MFGLTIGKTSPSNLLRKTKYAQQPNWKEYKVQIDENTPFQQMKKKLIKRFDVWELNAHGKMVKLIEENNRKQLIIKGMQMGIIKGQYKLMFNTNPNWRPRKTKRWRKSKKGYRKQWKSSGKRSQRRAMHKSIITVRNTKFLLPVSFSKYSNCTLY